MVRSRLEYCCPVWNPVKISDIQKIENVQRCFVRKIAGLKDMDYRDRLKKLKMMSLQRRRERYCIIQVWKIINEHAPNDVQMQFKTHSRLGIKALIPKINTKAGKPRYLFEVTMTVHLVLEQLSFGTFCHLMSHN